MRIVNGFPGLSEVVQFIARRIAKPKENDIYLYNLGSVSLAVGSNADVLYKKFGWDLSVICSEGDGQSISYMIITEFGFRFLRLKGMGITDWNSSYEYDEGEDSQLSICAVQQFIDYFRENLSDKEKIDYPVLRRKVSLEIDQDNYVRDAKLTSIVITKETAGVILDNNDNDFFPLVKNSDWNFNKSAVAILKELGKILPSQGDYLIRYCHDGKRELERQRTDNGLTYSVYTDSKKKHTEEVVLIKEKGFFITFDDDAVIVSSKIPLTIYDYWVSGRSCPHTTVILDSSQFFTLTKADINIHVVNDNSRELYRLGLRESFLNGKGVSTGDFKDAAVYKRSTGDYAVKASYGNEKLPEKVINSQYGAYYQNLPKDSAEKKIWLSALVHDAYDKSLAIRQNAV